MSVYTTISHAELDRFLQPYPLYQVTDFQGISDGIENTNYALNTLSGAYVLTIFESLNSSELNQFIHLQQRLSHDGFPCPHPIADRQGKIIQCIQNKPAALFTRLPGQSLPTVSLESCRAIGLSLAKLHLNAQDSAFNRNNPRDLTWVEQQFDTIRHRLTAFDAALLQQELRFQKRFTQPDLPQGIIHADLFRDNVLFLNNKISGIVDFYSACRDSLLLDIAICANDWCCIEGTINPVYIDVLLSGYESVRTLNAQERAFWPVMLRRAALRFWLSRLLHKYYPRSGELTQQKDPSVFRSILRQHQEGLTTEVL